MDKKILKMAVEVMRELSLTEICIKDGDTEIQMKRDSAVVPPAPIQPAKDMEPDTEVIVMEDNSSLGGSYEVTAPLIGVFYTSPTPTSTPFVQIGSNVKKGDVLCIIESMKMMNEIYSDYDGKITDICASDGCLVEYGQPLFRISLNS